MGIALSEKQVKEGWTVVRFDEIARNISERVEPAETDLEIYVGLEHLDPQSLRITRRGVPSDVEGQKLRVRPGQIIFGKRRAYQKKVAVADFDGICSAHAMVLQEIPGKIIPGLLPFFMQSDMFMDRAVAISEGSLSPTIKWKALAMQEFPLPPAGRQREILGVLEKVEEWRPHVSDALNNSQALFKVALNKLIWANQKSWNQYKIGDLGKIQMGRQRAPKYTTGTFTKKYVRVVNVIDGKLLLNDVEEMDFDKLDFERYKLAIGDLLITEGDITSVNNVGRCAIWNGEIENCCFQNTLIRFQASEKLTPRFAYYLFRAAFYKGVFATAANKTTVAHLGSTRFAAIKLGIPEVVIQEKIVAALDEVCKIEMCLQELQRRSIRMTRLISGQAFIQSKK